MDKKTIVITGSTRGIGRGLATGFLQAGHQVLINGRSAEKVQQAVGELQLISRDVIGVCGSVDEVATHKALIQETVRQFGKIDIWINNAGIPQSHLWFKDIDEQEISDITQVNIAGLLLGSKLAADFMLTQGFGKIINMEGFGSDGRMMDKLTLYGTTKRAVGYFTKAFAQEMAQTPVQVGVLSPGMVRTDFLENPLDNRTPDEVKQFKKVYDVLAEDPEVVTHFLVDGILKSTKNYDRIEFLAGSRLFARLLKMMFYRNK